MNRFDLTGKVAWVTGASYGIGYAIASGLAKAGATIVFNDIKQELVDKGVAAYAADGIEAKGYVCDVTDEDAVQALVKTIEAEVGVIDILVNNAVDRRNMVSLQDATREKLQASADTNLQGQILLSQAVLEYMIPAEKGSIINISSMRGIDCPHFPFYPETWGDQPVNYTTEKWAMVGLTKYMAGRYGKHHIRVNCIAPGGYSPGLEDNPDKKAFVKTLIDNTPLRCWANEDDIKGPVAFLASEAANYITGATLVMDGGWTIW